MRMGVQVTPVLSYIILVLNISLYIAGLALRFGQGESSAEDYFYLLALVDDEVAQGEYYRCELHPETLLCSCSICACVWSWQPYTCFCSPLHSANGVMACIIFLCIWLALALLQCYTWT
jgi:hypothetical protein